VIRLNLTVKLTEISSRDFTAAAVSPKSAQPLPICDRCHNIEEIVVVTMQIIPLEGTWALCGPCKQELPKGFHLA
jgi:hypothetical protein